MNALEHRIELVSWRTQEIAAAEAQATPDAALITALYGMRLSHIVEALELGATAEELTAITGNGI
jgi:hypothetical protein